jgi:hypothetical protein
VKSNSALFAAGRWAKHAPRKSQTRAKKIIENLNKQKEKTKTTSRLGQ